MDQINENWHKFEAAVHNELKSLGASDVETQIIVDEALPQYEGVSLLNAEIKKYFLDRYSAQNFLVVPGHWPDFTTKAEVDDWIDKTQKLILAVFNPSG